MKSFEIISSHLIRCKFHCGFSYSQRQNHQTCTKIPLRFKCHRLNHHHVLDYLISCGHHAPAISKFIIHACNPACHSCWNKTTKFPHDAIPWVNKEFKCQEIVTTVNSKCKNRPGEKCKAIARLTVVSWRRIVNGFSAAAVRLMTNNKDQNEMSGCQSFLTESLELKEWLRLAKWHPCGLRTSARPHI